MQLLVYTAVSCVTVGARLWVPEDREIQLTLTQPGFIARWRHMLVSAPGVLHCLLGWCAAALLMYTVVSCVTLGARVLVLED